MTDKLIQAERRFPRRLSREITEIIAQTGTNSPVARQYLPDAREMDILPAESTDPIGDHPHSPVKGIVHRYKNRALLKITNICAINCRFCFRKDMLGRADEGLSAQDIKTALAYISAHPEITEIIITGGDPLVLSPRRLATLFTALGAIDHLDIIRIHTRLPVAAPSLLSAPHQWELPADKALFMVLHINHSDEITPAMRHACDDLRRSGFMLLSQSVLLKNINDNHAALHDLFSALIALNIKPYYLHHPDLVGGTSHFRITFEHGMALMRELHKTLSGIALPSYVLDIPGGFGKIPVNNDYITLRDGHYHITDPQGRTHIYPLPYI